MRRLRMVVARRHPDDLGLKACGTGHCRESAGQIGVISVATGENVGGTLDTTGLGVGKHIVYVRRGMDDDGPRGARTPF